MSVALTYDTIARSAAESVAPELWPDHAWVPALGCTGGSIPNVGVGLPATNSMPWDGNKIVLSSNTTTMDFPDFDTGTDPYTMVIDMHPISPQNANPFIMGGVSDANMLYYDYISGTNRFYIRINGTVSASMGAYPRDRRISLALVRNSDTVVLYEDGRRFSSFTNAAIADTHTWGTMKYRTATTGYPINVYGLSFYRKDIARQLPALSADPLLPFRRRRLRSWFFPTVGSKFFPHLFTRVA